MDRTTSLQGLPVKCSYTCLVTCIAYMSRHFNPAPASNGLPCACLPVRLPFPTGGRIFNYWPYSLEAARPLSPLSLLCNYPSTAERMPSSVTSPSPACISHQPSTPSQGQDSRHSRGPSEARAQHNKLPFVPLGNSVVPKRLSKSERRRVKSHP